MFGKKSTADRQPSTVRSRQSIVVWYKTYRSPSLAFNFLLSAFYLQLSAFSFLLSAFCFLLSAFCFTSCSKPESSHNTSSAKFDQYYLQGEQLYLTHCSNCHQKDGSGLGLLYPPLNKSDFMDNNFEKVICLITHGIKGEIIVNGKSYNKPMTGVASLTDLEVAEIATYIYNSWEHKRGIIDVRDIDDNTIICDDVD